MTFSLPIAIIAFWTFAYDLVLVARWPAYTITWCFLAIAIAGFFALRRVWKKTNATLGKFIDFILPMFFCWFLGLGMLSLRCMCDGQIRMTWCISTRALSQLLDLHQPCFSCVRRVLTWMRQHFHRSIWRRVMRCSQPFWRTIFGSILCISTR